MEGKLKILGTNMNSEEIIQISLIFWAFGDFNCDVVKRRHPCLILGCTKMRSPGIGTVLHWRPLDVHIFGTDPSLVIIVWRSRLVLLQITFYVS